jgi:hypothetical protein
MDPKKENKNKESNPFSRFLRRNEQDTLISAFVERWDQVERLVIRRYRQEANPQQDQGRWQELRKSLIRTYPDFSSQLEEYWKGAAIAGQPATTDPFLWILAHEQVEAFENNWQALQTLPAAREAINRLLISRDKMS